MAGSVVWSVVWFVFGSDFGSSRRILSRLASSLGYRVQLPLLLLLLMLVTWSSTWPQCSQMMTMTSADWRVNGLCQQVTCCWQTQSQHTQTRKHTDTHTLLVAPESRQHFMLFSYPCIDIWFFSSYVCTRHKLSYRTYFILISYLNFRQ